jgi:hypothetical protein
MFLDFLTKPVVIFSFVLSRHTPPPLPKGTVSLVEEER